MTQDEQGYNGWTNYETWCVNLWLNNDRGLYERILNESIGKVEAKPYHTQYNVRDVAEYIEHLVSNGLAPHNESVREVLNDASLYSDLLRNSLQSVNYREIAKHFIDQAKESLEKDTNEYEIS